MKLGPSREEWGSKVGAPPDPIGDLMLASDLVCRVCPDLRACERRLLDVRLALESGHRCMPPNSGVMSSAENRVPAILFRAAEPESGPAMLQHEHSVATLFETPNTRRNLDATPQFAACAGTPDDVLGVLSDAARRDRETT